MKRTLGYLKPYAGRTALALFLKTAGSVSELVLPYLLSYIIDELTPLKDETAIWIAGGAMLFFSLLALFGNIAANRLSALVAGAMTRALRHDLFRKTSYLKCSQVDELTVPSLISRLTSDTYYVNQMVARTMRMGVRAPILLAGGLLFCFLLNARLALVLVAVIPVVAVPLFLITRKSVPMYLAVQKNGDRMVRTVQEDITGIRVIKALSKTEHESEKFGGIASDLASSEFRAQRVMSLTNPLTSLILNLGLVGVIVAGAFLSAEAGDITGFLTYFIIVLNAMLGISRIFVILSRGAASAERIEKVLALDEREKSEEHPAGDPAFAVEFKDVSFSYGGDKEHLTGISFALNKGASLGIIGPTGCGKSTVVNLLLRLYDVSAGAVYVDGQDVRSLPSEKLRKKFGVVFQNGYLMAASIRENIDYGRDLPEEAIIRAARCAQAEEFIKELPEGYGHDLAQKAGDLSGGQKQRLLIARALAASPGIVVLDDSSSALDYATDAALRRALQREYAGTTRIVVTQRVSSVKNCDLILVLENGSVTGAGTHASGVLSYLSAIGLSYFSRCIIKRIRADLFSKLMTLPVAYFDARQAGDIISVLSYDLDTLGESLANDVMMVLTSIVTIVGSFVMMLLTAPLLVTVFAVTIPLSALFTRWLTHKVQPLFRARSKKLGELNGYVEEVVSGQKTTKAYCCEEAFLARFEEKNAAAADAYTEAESYGTITGPSVNFMNNLSLSLVSVFGAFMYMNGVIASVGGIASFVLYSRKFSGPINEIANVLSEFQSALAAAERVFRVFEEPSEPADADDAQELVSVEGRVDIEHVRFGYDPEKPVLHDFTLHAERGELVAIVGHTGAGKTTLVNLLMRFYDAQAGRILIDGKDITEVTRASLRRSFAMVLQDTWLFSGSVLENVRYGSEDASREEVERVCREAKVASFVEKLPAGYDTVLTDNAVNISKGQKQLITIARAMLSDAPMLILDEATSNVDTRTEQDIQAAMERLMEGRTCFVIAHRLSTIRHAKNILVMDHGDVVEQGTHEELLARGGTYAKLYAAQFDAGMQI